MTRAPRRPSADWSSTTGLQRRLESQSVKEERKSHERNLYISRGVSRQQDEPANDNVERPSRSHSTISGSPRKMSTTLWSLTGYRPDAQPCRDRQAERLLIDRQRLSHR